MYKPLVIGNVHLYTFFGSWSYRLQYVPTQSHIAIFS